MICLRCHRPLKRPPVMVAGMSLGPKCAAMYDSNPAPTHERDLFGYSIAQGCEAATARVRVHIEILAIEALMDLRQAFNAARRRLGVWA